MEIKDCKIGEHITWADYYKDTYPGVILVVKSNHVKVKINHLKGDRYFWTYAHKLTLQ